MNLLQILSFIVPFYPKNIGHADINNRFYTNKKIYYT
jgi:hypothetical protein